MRKNRSPRRSATRHPIATASTTKSPDPMTKSKVQMPCALAAALLPGSHAHGCRVQKTLFPGSALHESGRAREQGRGHANLQHVHLRQSTGVAAGFGVPRHRATWAVGRRGFTQDSGCRMPSSCDLGGRHTVVWLDGLQGQHDSSMECCESLQAWQTWLHCCRF